MTAGQIATRYRMPSSSGKPRVPVRVVVGTSQYAAHAVDIARMVNDAYGYTRCSAEDITVRLQAGESAEPNRVLHLAVNNEDAVVGCASSSLSTAWTPSRCGHWGFLAVMRSEQKHGIAGAIVAAVEERLAAAGCQHVQIEYEFSPSSSHSQRLCAWYEGPLGYKRHSSWLTARLIGMLIGHQPKSEWRSCRKHLAPREPRDNTEREFI